MKHFNINICASIHLEKFTGKTILEESCYKLSLIYCYPPINVRNYRKLEENALFSYCALVSTISFCT